MTSTRRAEAGTGWMILGLFAIPVAAVSSAALLADVASTTDPTAAVVGVPAVLAGALAAGAVLRLCRMARSGAVALRAAVIALARVDRVRPVRVGLGRVGGPVLVPVVAHDPSPTGRRGPPFSRR